MVDLRDAVVALIARWGYNRRAEPFQLSSSGMSRDYIDGKRAIAQGERLRLVGKAIAEVARRSDVTFEAVGGLTMGADPIGLAVSIECNVGWFSVRKETKKHGKQKRVEGVEIRAGMPVLVVDDVVTTGRSLIEAIDALSQAGADVVMAIPMIDRGELTRLELATRGVRYEPLITYNDLGIEPVGRG